MRDVRDLSRLYDCGKYLIATNGFGAIVRPMPSVRPEGLRDSSGTMASAIAEYLALPTSAGNARLLLSLLSWRACVHCQSERRTTCEECDGEGTVLASCDECDARHTHTCSVCDGERTVACRICNKMAPIRIGGHPFDMRLVRLVVAHMGIGPEADRIDYGVSGKKGAASGWYVAFRRDDVIGVVMGAHLRDDEQGPSWG